LCYNQLVLQRCLVRNWIELAVVAAKTLFVPVPNVQWLFGAAARMDCHWFQYETKLFLSSAFQSFLI
jgi:hypothetical protein